MMKDFKETLRKHLREQSISNLPSAKASKVSGPSLQPPSVPPLALPASGEGDGESTTQNYPSWYNPSRIVPSKPGEPWTPPGVGDDPFYWNRPRKPKPKGTKPTLNPDDDGGDSNIITTPEGTFIVINGIQYPAVEVPPGSGNWEVDQSGGPNYPNSYPDMMPHDGNTYVFNVGCMCWQQMVYDPATNSWSWADPPATLPDDAVGGDGNPIGNPIPPFLYLEHPPGSGNWIQVYPPDGGYYHHGDPSGWSNCNTSHCMQQDADGNWYHWVPNSGHPNGGTWEPGGYGGIPIPGMP